MFEGAQVSGLPYMEDMVKVSGLRATLLTSSCIDTRFFAAT